MIGDWLINNNKFYLILFKTFGNLFSVTIHTKRKLKISDIKNEKNEMKVYVSIILQNFNLIGIKSDEQ